MNSAVRKGDTIKVMRGQFKGKKAKIASLDMIRLKIYLENIQVTKKDGTKANVHFDPSNLQITELVLEDKERKTLIAETDEEATWWTLAREKEESIKQLKNRIKRAEADLVFDQRKLVQRFRDGAKASITAFKPTTLAQKEMNIL